jgi:hypothetical protein
MDYQIRKLEEKIRSIETDCVDLQTKIDYAMKKK